MNNKTFWFRVSCAVILVVFTLCYIFGDVIQSWNSWFSGLAYAVAVFEIIFTFDKRRRKKFTGNKIFWRRVFYGVILVTLTVCYITGNSFIWGSWSSGLVYGATLWGLLGTFDGWRLK